MKKADLTDEAIGRAAESAMCAYLDSLPPAEECTQELSSEYRAKMERLMRRVRLREGTQRFAQSAAAVFLAFAVAIGGWLAVDADARASFFGWVREVFEGGVSYEYFGGHETAAVLPEVELTWLPEGFSEISSEGDDTQKVVVYQNLKNEDLGFVLLCQLNPENGNYSLTFHDEEYEYKRVSVNGMRGELYIPSDPNESKLLLWMDEELGITLSISSTLDESVILHIANSVKLSK